MMHSRGKGRHTDTSADEQNSFILEEVLTSTSERTVNHNSGQNTVDRGIGGSANNLSASCSSLFPIFGVEIAPHSFGQRTGEVTHNTNVDRDVILFWRAGEGLGS